MTGLSRNLLFLAALLTPGAAPAQDAARGDEPSTITVTGKRTTEKDMTDFVKALTPVTVGGQISRFEQSVCPVALGLSSVQADLVVSRMRRVAGNIGVPVGGASCVPNVVVVVTADKQRFVQELRNRHAHYFGDMPQRKIRELARTPGPAVAWQLPGAPVSARGVELAYDPGLGAYVNKTTEAASRLHSGARPQYDGAVVVVERGALGGLTTTQLADYAAMRAFARTDPSKLGTSPAPTILRVLEAPMGSEVPVTLTQWDMGFLRGLYNAPRNLHTGAQRNAISQSVAQEAGARAPK